ncbi:SDR family oxidoreductase [Streptomyces sp. NPDC002962]|uniref:SDR family oxidoreductase n=1 Tax=Streptomyces sp. NPDC002962 TaxID=3364674 RepID=UPI0036C1AC04
MAGGSSRAEATAAAAPRDGPPRPRPRIQSTSPNGSRPADGAAREALPARIPLGRVGTAEDIAWCAVHLASEESAWVTGGNLPVDGGVLAK